MKAKKPFVLARSMCMAICFLLLVVVCWSFFLIQQRSYAQVGKAVSYTHLTLPTTERV